eukprot:TRINITY_DN1678_c0_g1_i1.p1 TRINITY_DN1678_c0_g1~~TRINITY_DN1678_c0_g1_i1.p1  ORF type:complete len:131 (+),score=6.49 TRINITY_DN1678_c0_g1_i1:207-599(+)
MLQLVPASLEGMFYLGSILFQELLDPRTSLLQIHHLLAVLQYLQPTHSTISLRKSSYLYMFTGCSHTHLHRKEMTKEIQSNIQSGCDNPQTLNQGSASLGIWRFFSSTLITAFLRFLDSLLSLINTHNCD